MGIEERAAQKRVARSLEKLRAFLTKRGFTLSATVIASAMAAHSVHAAPVGISVTTTAAAAKGVAISATAAALVKGTMKTMMWLKLKIAAGIGATAVLAGGAVTMAISQSSSLPELPTTAIANQSPRADAAPVGDIDPSVSAANAGGNLTSQLVPATQQPATELSAQEILNRSKQAYAALTSYTDEGVSISKVGDNDVAPTIFSIKLARPNLYRIQWRQNMGFYAPAGLVWSNGKDNVRVSGDLSTTNANGNLDSTLGIAAGVSGGASSTIPPGFFDPDKGILNSMLRQGTREPDEAVGGIDCFVLQQQINERTFHVWIGKQDYLIRKVKTLTSTESLKKELEAQAKRNPQVRVPSTVSGDIESTQIHSNIVVNLELTVTDFAP